MVAWRCRCRERNDVKRHLGGKPEMGLRHREVVPLPGEVMMHPQTWGNLTRRSWGSLKRGEGQELYRE